MKNTKYFPKTTEVFEDSKKTGVEAYKEYYKIPNLKDYLNEVFRNEYLNYIRNEEYFPGCPFKIYAKTYQARLENFRSIYPDAYEFDFLKFEDAVISRLLRMNNDFTNDYYSFYKILLGNPHQYNLKASARKIRERYIDERVNELGHWFDVPGVDPIDFNRVPREMFELVRNPNAELETEIKPETSSSSSGSRNIKSLNWDAQKYSKLTSIYKSLEESGYLDCGLPQFKKIFSNTEEFTPVEWLQEKRALYYFYGLIIEQKLISQPKPKWPMLVEIFTNSEGLNPDSAKIEWSRVNKDEGNYKLFSFIKSLIDKA